MNKPSYTHAIEINEQERLVTIYRVFGDHRTLFTSVKLPERGWNEDPTGVKAFFYALGENIILDSPEARKLLGI
jgi:hypothetical protein